MSSCIWKAFRRKSIDSLSNSLHTSLRRCLTTFDLTFINIGAMVGSGIYVMTGIAAKEMAGPGIILSFLIAAVFVSLNAMCFVELAARVPRTGTSYLYVYCSLGEVWAFLTGWCVLFSIIAGAAVNACSWSAYMNFLFHDQVKNLTQTYIAHWESAPRPLSTQPDILACVIIIIVVFVIAMGANCSSKINAVIVCINVMVLLFTSVVGFIYADLDNWRLKDKGGFLPFGFGGVLSGATACFWAMSGYEAAAVSIEEAKTPQKSIPRATLIAILSVTVLYLLTSSAITLVTPYDTIDTLAPLPSAFASRDITWAKYIVLFGPLCGLTTTLLNSVFGFVRITYAMSKDGLLFPFLSNVHGCSRIPLWPVFVCALVILPISCFMDLKDIIGFGIVLALLQYTLISITVLILRYRPVKQELTNMSTNSDYSTVPLEHIANSDNFDDDDDDDVTSMLPMNGRNGDLNGNANVKSLTLTAKQSHLHPRCTWLSRCLCCSADYVTLTLIILMLVSLSGLSATVYMCYVPLTEGDWVVLVSVLLLTALSLVLVCLLAAHKQNVANLVIKMPMVPWIPCLSILLSLLLLAFNSTTSNWAVTGVIAATGILLYFSYGIHFSKHDSNQDYDRVLLDDNCSDRQTLLNREHSNGTTNNNQEVVTLLSDDEEETIWE